MYKTYFYRALLPVLLGTIFCRCSSVLTENDITSIPVYSNENFKYIPGEILDFEVEAGLLRVGEVRMEVRTNIDTIQGKGCAVIIASAASRKGLAFISKIKHNWTSWIDTSLGRTLQVEREATENNYQTAQKVWFYPDSQIVFQKETDHSTKPPFRAKVKPNQMYDLINVIWQLRYTKFENYKPGDTLRYIAYFDRQWLHFNVRYKTIANWKSGRRKTKAMVLQILGVHSRYLRGENPVEVWIESTSQRKPLKIRIASYLGSLEVKLKP